LPLSALNDSQQVFSVIECSFSEYTFRPPESAVAVRGRALGDVGSPTARECGVVGSS